MWRGLLLFVGLVGCGRANFDSMQDATAIDPSIDGAVDYSGPFGAPSLVAELSTSAAEDDVSLTADGLEVYFLSTRLGPEKLFVSTRTTIDATWTPPVLVTDVDMGGVNNARVSADGLTLVFASSRPPNAGSTDMWRATRPDRQSPWTVARYDELATATNDFEPWLTQSGLAIYFVRTVTTKSQLHVAERASTSDPFGAPRLISDQVVNSNYEGSPWLDAGETTLVFHRGIVAGNYDLYIASRASRLDPFDSAVPLGGATINTPMIDQDAWLSPDGRTLYFSSDRSGNHEIYMATR